MCLAGSLLIGCSAYQAPVVHVGSAVITQQTDEAIRLEVPVELENPNNETIDLLTFTYTVTVDGIRVYEGKRNAGAALGPHGTSRAMLPAVVRHDQMPWPDGQIPTATRWAIQGRVYYMTPSKLAEILQDLRLRNLSVRLVGDGEIDPG